MRPAHVPNDGLPARLQREAGDRIYSGLLHGFRVRRVLKHQHDIELFIWQALGKLHTTRHIYDSM